MEQRGIDLRKFIPDKANKWYMIKVLIYALVLAGLFYYLFDQLDKKKQYKLEETTVDGIQLEVPSNQN